MTTATLPSTPNPSTGLTTPLLSYDDYASLTGDSATDPEDVGERIVDAIYELSQECRRTFGYGQYTELLYLYANGMVFPSATPIDHAQAVSAGEQLYNPATDNQPGEGSIIQGAGIWVGWFTPLPWMPVWTGVVPPQTTVTYYGGYQPYRTTSGPTPGLPPKLARMIAKITYYLTHPIALDGMPGGARSMSVGGVSISGGLSSFMDSDPQLKRDVQRFTRRQAHAWEI